jgi:hypothetical protein
MKLKLRVLMITAILGTAVSILLAGCDSPLAPMGSYNDVESRATVISSNKTGSDPGDSYYYSFWKGANDGSFTGSASMTISTGTTGNYSTTWNNVSNFTAGKGWSTGKADRVLIFSGSFNGGSNGYLAAYGWARTSIQTPQDYSVVEYYVVENYGSWTPPGTGSANEPIVSMGSFTASDGGTYNMYKGTRKSQPWIVNNGNGTFNQYWSVRTSKRSSGTINFKDHVNAWASKGMTLGAFDYYQIMETEGYHSSGSSDITVTDGGTGVIVPPPDTQRPSAPALTGGAMRHGIYRDINLYWTAASDNVGVTKYVLYHNGSVYKTFGSSTLSWGSYRINPFGGTHSFYVRAYDAAGNWQASNTYSYSR